MSFWKPGEAKTGVPPEDAPSTKSSPKPALSKNVLSMRFMKKREEGGELAAQEELKRQKLLSPESVVPGLQSSSGHSINTSSTGFSNKILVCTREMTNLYSALPGRRSFGGFNKPIERNYDLVLNKHKADKRYGRLVQESNDGDANDEELLTHFKNMRGKKRKAPPKIG